MGTTRYGFLKEFCAQDLKGFALMLGHDAQGFMQIRIKLAAEVLASEAHAGLPAARYAACANSGL